VPELEDEMALRKKKEKADVEKKKQYSASADFDSIPAKVRRFGFVGIRLSYITHFPISLD
jgi:hypothetical protein